MSKSFKQGVSVIICCYNSKKRLKPTLEHIVKQKVSKDILWEVILVNNNSTDGTNLYAEKIWTSLNCKIPFQVVDEPMPGLSNARRKGIETACYEYILFCDDDNWLNPLYVNTAYEIMSMNNHIGVLGGIGNAVFDKKEPEWFQEVKSFYAVGRQHDLQGDIGQKAVYGAGMVIRKSYLTLARDKGFTPSLLGRKKNQLSSGEDHELCLLMILLGYKIWYDEQLHFQHFITSNRLNWPYFKRLRKSIAYSSIYIIPYLHEISNKPTFLSWYILRFLKVISINFILVFVSAFYYSTPNKAIFLLHQILSEIKHPLKVYHLRKKINKWRTEIS